MKAFSLIVQRLWVHFNKSTHCDRYSLIHVFQECGVLKRCSTIVITHRFSCSFRLALPDIDSDDSLTLVGGVLSVLITARKWDCSEVILSMKSQHLLKSCLFFTRLKAIWSNSCSLKTMVRRPSSIRLAAIFLMTVAVSCMWTEKTWYIYMASKSWPLNCLRLRLLMEAMSH